MPRLREPIVVKIAETRVIPEGVKELIGHYAAEDWLKNTSSQSRSDAEFLTEIAGRVCYKSFGLGLNPNITKIRESPREYVENILKSKHGSVIEHACDTFAFLNVSRVFTHELVRHRAGVAISQESLRYVRPRELRMTMVPGSELSRLSNLDEVTRSLEGAEEEYLHLVEGTIRPEMKFDETKAWTSALRRFLPDGMATNIVWTANHRT